MDTLVGRALTRGMLVLLVGALFGPAVHSQVTVPSTAEPGQIERRFAARPTPRSEPLTLPDELEKGRLVPEGARQKRFIVQEIHIAPSTVYDTAALQALAADFPPGSEISVADLYTIADRITAKYGNDGYVLSRAFLPAQKLGDGIAKIGLLEGFVDDVDPEGNDARNILALARARVQATRPFNQRVLERYLLIGNDQPGVSVQSFFRKSETTPGASTLLLRVTEDEGLPVAFSLGIDNRGAETTGPLELDGSLTLSNLTGGYDETRARVVQSVQLEELTFASLSHSQLLTPEGTRLTVDGTFSTSEPGGSVLRSIEQESESFSAKLTLSHPFIRSRSRNLTAHVALGGRNTQSEQLGVVATRDRLRTLEVGFDYDFGDAWGGVNQFNTTVTQGITGLGATTEDNPRASRFDGDPDFMTLAGTVSRQQTLPHGFGLNLAAQGQYASTPLLSSAECGLGGEAFGRAFDSSEIVGDHCLMGSAELTYLVPYRSEHLRFAQAYTFVDGGRVWNRGATPNASLASFGGGVRFGVTKYLTGSVEIAQPLRRDVAAEGDRDPRLFFRLTSRF